MIKSTLQSRRSAVAVIGLSVGAWLMILLARQYSNSVAPWQRVCYSPPFNQLEDGTTAIEVRRLLGPPTEVHPVPGKQTVDQSRTPIVEQWWYDYPGIMGGTVIYFGENDRVVTHSCGPV